MAISELRAKDLAAIEPPGSIGKIVQFTEQLSFGQDALFAGAELPVPPIAKHALISQEFALKVSEHPYAFFPGSNGEGLDTLMSRYTLRNRDIQDFSKWLMRWEDRREQLAVFESPEQYFLHRATPQMLETVGENPDIQRIVLEGRRRRPRVEEVVQETEFEDRVVRVERRRVSRDVEVEVEPAPERRPRRRPTTPAPEPDYGAYWREPGVSKVEALAVGGRAVSTAAAAPIDPSLLISSFNRSVLTSNLSLGGMTSGLIKGRADAAASFQAQEAAADALKSSSVSSYIPPQPGQLIYQVPPQFPPPDVVVEQIRGGPPIEVRTDWPGAPRAVPLPGKPTDYVLVPREAADERGIGRGQAFRPVDELQPRGDFAGAHGVASQVFSNQVALRALAGMAGVGGLPAIAFAFGSGMPQGNLARKDLFAGAAAFAGQAPQPMLVSNATPEGAARPPFPASPLMGQITLVSPPMHVASPESERAGSAVAFDVRNLGMGGGALDAGGLAMLQQSLPPGARAIYPALPQGSLGPQAVNMPLAPSLLEQILTQGYGPAAGAMAPAISASASALTQPSGGAMRASLVPTMQRPTDAATSVLGHDQSGPGALKHAGAANASRGGALDFLGMPVRLAPSLAGSADVQQAAEARKVLPTGAAAIIRPNEFGPLRTKLFPSMSTIHAEPDKSAWRQAAPSFGLRDAEPHTLLSPDSRLKPPEAGAPLPQLQHGGESPAAKALQGATLITPAASAAIGSEFVPGGGAVRRAAHTALDAAPTLNLHQAVPPGMGRGLGSVSFSTPTITPHLAARRGSPFAGVSALGSGLSRSVSLPSAASLASANSSRVASRYSPAHPSIGTGPTGHTREQAGIGGRPGIGPEAGTTHAPSTAIAISAPGGARSPLMPDMHPGLGAGVPAPPASPPSYAMPTLSKPAVATTAGGRSSPSVLSMPASGGFSMPSMTPAQPAVTTSSSTLVRRAPAMPIATSVSAGSPVRQSSQFIQRATGAVQPNRTEHAATDEQSSTTAKAQDPGATAHEVNLLANEVWSLLKRKLQFEAERLGKRY